MTATRTPLDDFLADLATKCSTSVESREDVAGCGVPASIAPTTSSSVKDAWSSGTHEHRVEALLMPAKASRLTVLTAPLIYEDMDMLNITRKTGGRAGHPFAPSWDLVRPVVQARRAGDKQAEAEAWMHYVPAYYAEMERSYTRDRGPWLALLARERVVLACYCTAPTSGPLRCHRVLLADILQRLGPLHGRNVDVRGEVPAPSTRTRGVPF